MLLSLPVLVLQLLLDVGVDVVKEILFLKHHERPQLLLHRDIKVANVFDEFLVDFVVDVFVGLLQEKLAVQIEDGGFVLPLNLLEFELLLFDLQIDCLMVDGKVEDLLEQFSFVFFFEIRNFFPEILDETQLGGNLVHY